MALLNFGNTPKEKEESGDEKSFIRKMKKATKDSLKFLIEENQIISKRKESILNQLTIGETRAIAMIAHYKISDSKFATTISERALLDNDYRTLSFARILKSGDLFNFNLRMDNHGVIQNEGQHCSPGDIIRLSDNSSLSVVNPKFQHWNKNSKSNSNGDKIGDEPVKWKHGYFDTFGNSIFVIDPLSEPEIIDYFIFELDYHSVKGIYTNPEILLK